MDSLEKGVVKLLIININLAHLWSDLQNNKYEITVTPAHTTHTHSYLVEITITVKKFYLLPHLCFHCLLVLLWGKDNILSVHNSVNLRGQKYYFILQLVRALVLCASPGVALVFFTVQYLFEIDCFCCSSGKPGKKLGCY